MEFSIFSDEYFMQEALKEAQKALELGEVPVGAVVVQQGRIIARAHNLTQTLTDATAHAEMQAITAASNFLGAKYLINCTLYVSLEPCYMCAGALAWTQISKVVCGAPDQKHGFTRLQTQILHPKTEYIQGVLQHECSHIIKDFFKEKR
jgi:tRNA(adenine34) deaminase